MSIISASLNVSFNVLERVSYAGVDVDFNPALLFQNSFAVGTGAMQVNAVSVIVGSATNTPSDIDVRAGVGMFSAAIVLNAVKAIIIQSEDTSSDALTVEVAAANGFDGPFTANSEGIVLQPDTVAVFINSTAGGWTADASNRLLTLTAVSAADYTVWLLGHI